MPNVGNPIGLSVQLFDGNASQFVRARIFDNLGNELVGSPVSVPAVVNGGGLYQAVGPAMPNVPYVAVQYKVYSDSGFTTPSVTYADSQERQEQTFSSAQIATAVWDQLQANSQTSGSFGAALQGVITPARAANLDKIDANTSSVLSVLGTPAGASVSADVASIVAKTSQLSFAGGNVNAVAQVIADKTGYTLTAPANVAIANAIWNSLTSSYTSAGSFGLLLGTGSNVVAPSSITAIVQGVWNALSSSYVEAGSMGAIMASLNANISQNLNTLASQASITALATVVAGLASQSSVSNVISLIGTPVNSSLAADVAQVKSDTGTLTSRLTAARAGYLDNLNVSLAGLATQSSLNSILALIGAPVTTLSGDIASIAETVTSLASNYTAARAAKLDLISTPTSGLATQELLGEVYALLGQPVSGTLAGDINDAISGIDALPTAQQIWTYTTRGLNQTVNANVDLSALATASQLTAVQESILAAQGASQVQATVSFNKCTGIVTVLVWLLINGVVVPAPTTAAAQIYNAAGSLVLDLGLQTQPTSGGVFEFQAGGATALLPPNQAFTLRTLVANGSTSVAGLQGFTTFS